MNSVERVKQICKERGIAVSKLERDLGYGNAYVSQLRKGKFPADRLHQIAEYLNVSPEYLMTGEETKKAPGTEAEGELLEYLEELRTRPEMKMLFHTFKGATKEQIEAIVAAWEAMNEAGKG